MTRATSYALALALSAFAACSPARNSPQTGSQTNWLTACESSDECGGLQCLCGACTAACDGDDACGDLEGAACFAPGEQSAIAFCQGSAPQQSLCLPQCEPACAEGSSCIAGLCVPDEAPIETPMNQVTIDTSTRHQTLQGIGASLAFAEDPIAAHPNKAELFDLAFKDAGLDALRVSNRYDGDNSAQMLSDREIIAAATERLGRAPLLFMTSATPPAALKASGERSCAGDLETCTLSTLPSGGFDYEGFARYWRDSLVAYADAGVTPDYVSIQNHPNWIPTADGPGEACRFLPEEGTEQVAIDGAAVEVAYPGYREAFAAVRAAIADLPSAPRLAAPEGTGLRALSEYAALLDGASIDALALHLYGQSAATIDLAALEAARTLAEQLDRPVFQTEMQADGLETALLMHYAFTSGGASAYLQNDLVALTRSNADVAVVLMTSTGFTPQQPYYALSHFAQHTAPGWVRVDATSDLSGLLSSAWLAPDESALTLVVINPGSDELEVNVAFASGAAFAHSDVTRTVFAGDEQLAELGPLSPSGAVRIPSHAIVTVAFSNE